MLEHALRYKLINTTAISDIVSTRVFPNYVPDKQTYPLLMFSFYGHVPGVNLSNDRGIDEINFDIEIITHNVDTRNSLDAAILAALKPTNQLWDDMRIYTCTRSDTDDDAYKPEDSNQWIFNRVLTYEVVFKSVPESIE